MKHVALSKFLFIFYVGSSLTWPNQKNYGNMMYENDFQFRLSKMSKVCTVIAETCMKCTHLKACFWCGDNGEGESGCYADSDALAKQKCYGKSYSYWDEKPCVDANKNPSNEEDYYSHSQWSPPAPQKDNIRKNVLVKLLLLLTTLKDSDKKNEISMDKEIERITSNKNNQNRINIGVISNTISTQSKITKINIGKHMINKTKKVTDNVNKLQYDEKELNKSKESRNESTLIEDENKVLLKNVNISLFSTTTNTTIKASTNFITHSNHKINETKYVLTDDILIQSTLTTKPITNYTTLASMSSETFKHTVKVFLKDLNENVCQKQSSCEDCVTSASCYWCGADSFCNRYPGKSYVNTECKERILHKTCSQEIPVFIFALCIIIITFFLSFGYLCARKCYYFQRKPVEVKLEERPILFKQKNGRTVYQITESEEDEEEKLFQNGKEPYTRNKVGAAPNNPAVW